MNLKIMQSKKTKCDKFPLSTLTLHEPAVTLMMMLLVSERVKVVFLFLTIPTSYTPVKIFLLVIK